LEAHGGFLDSYSGGDNQTHDYISPYWGNFASDVPKDFEADADDTIVINKLLVNKLTLAVDKFYLQRSR
jgi:hypothetical protein